MFSFVKVSRLPSQRTRSQVSCSIEVSENAAHRIEATAENIFPATKDHVTKATDAINRGQVIAVPTDTIYGFACDACSREETTGVLDKFGFVEAS
ncbi:yrdC domain-containing protein, mitochondrial [Panicum miliaceum]|uniref:Threonylcarbamoyl-AMP synthase n=1 Tax=Panicum miliaceum TaxID=4540 RepID=A0A3L6TR45_PANMI|nr:yrdC domain-containing protein, mitochondrial [Panicum miliaceum]